MAMREACLRISIAVAFVVTACGKNATSGPAERPSILLVTLDTTRADAVGPEATQVVTPAFNALAAHGLRFRQAYATVPETLPSHLSMMTGLYPAGHGVHENGKYLGSDRNLVAERLKSLGYRTAAFVSTFALNHRFGIGRGFDVYDDEVSQSDFERTSAATTDRAIAFLAKPAASPLFLWVHYYDAHHPYTPPEPYRSRYSRQPYYGEVAEMDEQFARLRKAFERTVRGPVAIIVVGDHGEGLGEHGEMHHRQLLYQSTMHVPLIIAGPGFKPGIDDSPVSTRHIYSTLLDIAGARSEGSLRAPQHEIVLGEAMMPFLEYSWQPQVMAVDGRYKTILAGRPEVYDIVGDPAESHDLAATSSPSRSVRAALTGYPLPSLDAPVASGALDEEDRRKLASLGYVSSGKRPVISKDAPRPADMTRLFETLEKANEMTALYKGK